MTTHRRPQPGQDDEPLASAVAPRLARAMETRPTKAQLAALGAFLTAMLGALLTARHAGAPWSVDLVLDALYFAATGSSATGVVVWVKTNRPKAQRPRRARRKDDLTP